MWRPPIIPLVLLLAALATAQAASPAVRFDAQSARSGKWSDGRTWVDKRAPRTGDNVRIRAGHVVSYDANTEDAVRVVHVAGTLTFARDKSTRLNVGLLKSSAGRRVQ